MLVGASGGDPIKYAKTLDKVGKDIGIDFIGGYSALVQKASVQVTLNLLNQFPKHLLKLILFVRVLMLAQQKRELTWML